MPAAHRLKLWLGRLYPLPAFMSSLYRIEKIDFSGGETIGLEAAGLLILVGPNNSGKSRLLRDVETLWNGRAAPESVRVASSMSVAHNGDWAEVDSWLREHYSVKALENGRISYSGIGAQTQLSHASLGSMNHWFRMDAFKGFVISRLDTESRLRLSNPPERIDPFNDKPQHFNHVMQANDLVYERVREEVKAAFDLDLVIDFAGGRQVALYVGDEPDLQAGWDRVHPGYARAIRDQMDPLQEAGDGVRSYVVTLASALSESQPVLLVDEPEAFLHPPQARRIGKLLGELATSRNRQIIAATHSSDLVRGALSSGGRVEVLRIDPERSGLGQSVNHANLLGYGDLLALWEKPILKSSHAIDGVFHRGAVVCEADSDARFYESILLRMEENGLLGRPADLHFVQGGGKGELPTLARSYSRLQVPVAVIADFDILRSEADVTRVVEALGHDFSAFEHDFRVASSALAEQAPLQSESEALNAVEARISQIRSRGAEGSITGADRRAISAALNDAQQWSEAKRYGVRRLRGEQRQAGDRLLDNLASIGLFVVRNGELESWDESLPSEQKDVWIREALEKVESDPSSFYKSVSFMKSIASFLNSIASESVA